MWRNIISWVFDFLSHIGDFGTWLFTPININIASEGLSDFYKEMNASGLSNVPTWLYDFLAKSTAPIEIAPIGILSIGFLSIMLTWWLIKFFIK